jgi:hypothetical protein
MRLKQNVNSFIYVFFINSISKSVINQNQFYIMTLNDDLFNKAEAEMKLYDAKMMEEARIKKLASAPLNERIIHALHKTDNDVDLALNYLLDHHMIHHGEHVDADTIRAVINQPGTV